PMIATYLAIFFAASFALYFGMEQMGSIGVKNGSFRGSSEDAMMAADSSNAAPKIAMKMKAGSSIGIGSFLKVSGNRVSDKFYQALYRRSIASEKCFASGKFEEWCYNGMQNRILDRIGRSA
ncbi:MAG: hypothetical protein IKH16_04705, partial [Selenomonadaceae bacterium]|nr:hypothetical protein [Selenomonadaceae bacterium]